MTRRITKLSYVLIVVILLLSLLPMSALAAQSGGYIYDVYGGQAVITEYVGSGGAITIPLKLGGYPVTGIWEEAFYGCNSLTSVTIPGGVTSIGERAFMFCENLGNVTILAGVTSIGDWAFFGCESLTSVTIPESVTNIGSLAFCYSALTSVMIPSSVTSIGDEAFAYSNRLSAIDVNIANRKYSSQDGVLFNKAKTDLIQYPTGNARTSYTIPGSVTSIMDRAFYRCRILTSINIPVSVASIGAQVFFECSNLSSITIPGSISSIWESTFEGCRNLTSVTISVGVTSIGDYAFNGCYGLENLTIPGSITNIGYGAFSSCQKLDKVFFQGDAPNMDDDVFLACKSGFTVYYLKGKTGYTNPWHGYPTVAIVPPTAPASVTASSASFTSVKLTWSTVAGASGYVVYRATSSNGSYTQAAVIPSGATASYTSAGLNAGTTYYYKLRAYRTVGTTKVYGDYSAVASAKPAPAVPANVKAASASYNSVKVTWGAVAGANGYVVYRSASSNGAYTMAAVISSGSTASYTNAGLTTGKSYCYKVRAYRTVGTAKVYSDYSTVASARPVPAAPVNVKAASASYNSVKLTWSVVAGASGYVVYQATSSNGTYTLAAVLPGGSAATYTNVGLTTGTTYYYKLRAYRTVGAAKVYGGYSAVVSAKPMLSTPTGVNAARASASSIKVSWNAVAGVTKYEVWRATSSGGTFYKLPDTTALSYTNTGLTTGKTYYYKVRAYRTVGATKVYGGYSAVVSAKP